MLVEIAVKMVSVNLLLCGELYDVLVFSRARGMDCKLLR